MARRFRSSAGRGQRLSRRWLGFATDSTLFGLSAGNIAITLAAASTLKDTVMRTRGSICGFLDGAGAPAEAFLVSMGMWIVPEGTGTTILGDPFSDPNADWFFYSQFLLGHEELVIDVIDIPVISGYREVIDSKAMRISTPDTEVQLVVTNTTISGAGSVNVFAAGRFLLGT